MFDLFCAAIGYTWSIPGENEFILWFQSLAGKGSFLYYVMNFISMLGEETILVAVVGLVYWALDKRRGEQMGFTMIAATLVNPLIKNIVRRTRPFDSNAGIQNFRDVSGYSFPSGHSSGSASTYVGAAVAYKGKQKWLIAVAVVLPVLVALSRTYLGAHYPSDVICGLALGVALVFLINWLFRVIDNKLWIYIGMLAIGLAGFFYCTTSDFYTAYGLLGGFVCGVVFEKRVTKFDNTKVWWRVILRVAAGGGLFFGMNELLKLIVGAIYPDYNSNVWFERIFRVLRYAVVTFVDIGVYPLLFAQTDKLWRKWGWIKSKEQENCAETAEQTATDKEEQANI